MFNSCLWMLVGKFRFYILKFFKYIAHVRKLNYFDLLTYII